MEPKTVSRIVVVVICLLVLGFGSNMSYKAYQDTYKEMLIKHRALQMSKFVHADVLPAPRLCKGQEALITWTDKQGVEKTSCASKATGVFYDTQ